jgi:glucokinase
VVGESLGVALAALVNTFNFPLYLLSGGMLPAWDLFAPQMMQTLVESVVHTTARRSPRTRVEKATAGE